MASQRSESVSEPFLLNSLELGACAVLHHHDGAIHHRPDGNRNASQDMILAFSPGIASL